MSGLGQNPEAGETGIGRQRFREAALAIGKEIGAVENFLRDALRGHHENADRLLEVPAKVEQAGRGRGHGQCRQIASSGRNLIS